jgi:hemoglobin/transferrin/lactoferrin receptor protein
MLKIKKKASPTVVLIKTLRTISHQIFNGKDTVLKVHLFFRILGPLLFFLIWPSSSPATTDPETIALDPVIVSARGHESLISRTPGGTALVDAEEIFRVQPISLSHALQGVAGVQTAPDSPWGSAISIRGLGRNRVLLLIDGCRVNTATDINAQFGLLDPGEVERMEVLKGPVSALYGSGSIGGVVHVITQKGEFSPTPTNHLSLSTRYATNPQGYALHTRVVRNTPQYWVYASSSQRDAASYQDGEGQTIPNSQFQDQGLNLKAGYRWNALHQTRMQYQFHEGREIGIPGRGEASLPAAADVTYPKTHRMLMDLSHGFTPEGGLLKRSDLTLFYQRIDRKVRIDKLPNATGMNEILPSALHETLGLKWIHAFERENHAFTAGLDAWDWTYEGKRIRRFLNGTQAIDQPLADARQFSGGVFAEHQWAFNPVLSLNLGGRLDGIHAESKAHYAWVEPPSPETPNPLKRNSRSFHTTSWDLHAGLTWTPIPAWSLTLLAASSYRAPDLMERFKYLNMGTYEVYGTPDLDPERSLFLEAGLHYGARDFRASINTYANQIHDLIVEHPVSDTRYEMRNVQQARIHGAEMNLEWRFVPSWKTYASLAWTQGRNKTENEDLARIPPLNGLVGLARSQTLGLNGELDLVWAERQTRTGPEERETPGWFTLNTRLAWRFRLADSLQEVSLAVHNLLDAAYRNHLATGRKPAERNEAGRNLMVSYRMEW